MYCVLSHLPKSCINFLFLGPGNFWDTDKEEKGPILEETIPRIFLLTPSLHAVSMGSSHSHRRGFCGTFQSSSLVDSLSLSFLLSLPPLPISISWFSWTFHKLKTKNLHTLRHRYDSAIFKKYALISKSLFLFPSILGTIKRNQALTTWKTLWGLVKEHKL